MKLKYSSALVLILFLALGIPAGAQQADRAKSLGRRMLCMCGCNQVLTDCNHVGCPSLSAMTKELDERVARNEPDDLTLQAFVQEYGQAVLAAPEAKGFGLAAWIMPGAVSFVGLILLWFIVDRWRKRAVVAPAAKVSPELLARAQRDADREGDL
jgi:cytochrome c-type biogenesis protein CcmH